MFVLFIDFYRQAYKRKKQLLRKKWSYTDDYYQNQIKKSR